MYRYIDAIRIIASGLAAAVLLAAASHDTEKSAAAKNCLFFPQFTQAAAADRSSPLDSEDITYSFRIFEILQRLWE